MNSKVVSTTAFVVRVGRGSERAVGNYVRLVEGADELAKSAILHEAASGADSRNLHRIRSGDLAELPGAVIAYWLSKSMRVSCPVTALLLSSSLPRGKASRRVIMRATCGTGMRLASSNSGKGNAKSGKMPLPLAVSGFPARKGVSSGVGTATMSMSSTGRTMEMRFGTSVTSTGSSFPDPRTLTGCSVAV